MDTHKQKVMGVLCLLGCGRETMAYASEWLYRVQMNLFGNIEFWVCDLKATLPVTSGPLAPEATVHIASCKLCPFKLMLNL